VEPAKGLFLVTEYYAGGDLEKWMREICEQPPEQRENYDAGARRTLHQVAYALSYLHASGVAHRDIKPGNVLLSGDEALLTDFGLASLPGVKVSAKPVGTMEFMAPELYRDEPCGEACDVWALGIILVQLLSAVARGLILHPFVELDTDSTHLYVSLLRAYLDEEPWDREVVSEADSDAHELLDAILVYGRRCSSTFVMNHAWTHPGRSMRPSISSVPLGANLRGWVKLPEIDRKLLQINADFVSKQSAQMRKLQSTFEEIDEAGDGQLHVEELQHRMEREVQRGTCTEDDVRRAPSWVSSASDAPERKTSHSVGFGEFVAINVSERDLLSNGASELCFDSLSTTTASDEISVDTLANALGENAEALEGLLGKGTVSKREFTSLTEAALHRRRLESSSHVDVKCSDSGRLSSATSPTITPSSQAISSFEPAIFSPDASPVLAAHS
jgi:serine/threonine protein kinase